MKPHRLALGLSLVAAVGCSSDSTQSCGGKCVDMCEVAATTPVAWADPTALGSPAQLFSSFAGSCQAPFAWDASGWGGALTVVPAQGKSTLSATVQIDTASARLLT
jgi:hypothetical protein